MLVDKTIAWHFVNAGQEPVTGISGISHPPGQTANPFCATGRPA